MKFNTDILQKLNEIYEDRENAADLEGVFCNYKQGRTILLTKAKRDEQFCINNYDFVINLADKIPSELIKRLSKTVQDYIEEQNQKLEQVEINNLPWNEKEN